MFQIPMKIQKIYVIVLFIFSFEFLVAMLCSVHKWIILKRLII